MSGIAGMLRFDSRPVDRSSLERMANALRPHGPDRSAMLVDNPIGLTHVLMRMTPEDQFDHQPFSSSSGLVICADLRLDNRDSILSLLSIAAQEAIKLPDSDIVLMAYEKFGDDLWPMLAGPFAVAIWNPRERVLTLARDQLGLNTVMWFQNKDFFAFSTMPKGLFATGEVPRLLNEEKMADFLVLNHAAHNTTIYKDVYRLPPANVMKIGANGVTHLRQYWSVKDIKPIRLNSDQAYADGLRACLDGAVRRQMRSAHPIGCHLTGGLDSSSIAMLAARALDEKSKRLPTYTQVPRSGFDGPVPSGWYADEVPFVTAIAEAAGNIDVNYVRNDKCDEYAELDRITHILEAPIRNPGNLGWMLAIARLARSKGQRVLLGGLHGNYTFSWDGWSQPSEHLMQGRILIAFKQWQLFYKETAYSQWDCFKLLFLQSLTPKKLSSLIGNFKQQKRMPIWQSFSAVNLSFAENMCVDTRAAENGHDFLYRLRPGSREEDLMAVDYNGDWLAAEKAITGVEVRDPAADMEVVSYCFGIPSEQYLAEGISRSLIRRAMWGITPNQVLTNRRKGSQAPDWYEKLGKRHSALANELSIISSSPLARKMIDLERLSKSLNNWPTGGWANKEVIEEYNLAFTRGLAVGKFLRWIDPSNQ